MNLCILVRWRARVTSLLHRTTRSMNLKRYNIYIYVGIQASVHFNSSTTWCVLATMLPKISTAMFSRINLRKTASSKRKMQIVSEGGNFKFYDSKSREFMTSSSSSLASLSSLSQNPSSLVTLSFSTVLSLSFSFQPILMNGYNRYTYIKDRQ